MCNPYLVIIIARTALTGRTAQAIGDDCNTAKARARDFVDARYSRYLTVIKSTANAMEHTIACKYAAIAAVYKPAAIAAINADRAARKYIVNANYVRDVKRAVLLTNLNYNNTEIDNKVNIFIPNEHDAYNQFCKAVIYLDNVIKDITSDPSRYDPIEPRPPVSDDFNPCKNWVVNDSNFFQVLKKPKDNDSDDNSDSNCKLKRLKV